MYSLALQPFDIRNFADRLISEGKNRYQCPACDGNNLTFSSENYTGYTCWNDDSEHHRSEIREAIAPWSEVQQQYSNNAALSGALKSRKQGKYRSKPVPLPGTVILARLQEPATDMPQPQERFDRKRGKILVTNYRYSSLQWVERVQWADPKKSKGYSKEFHPWHIGEDNKPVCKCGDTEWLPYRWQEAVAAAHSSTANTLLICEGEGCVEAYRSIGFAATTFQGSKWGESDLQEVAKLLKEQELAVIIHPDNDSTGNKKAAKLQKACNAIGVACLVLNPLKLCSELPESGDIVDCLEAMTPPEYIRRLEAEIHAALAEQQQSQSQAQPQEKKRPGQTIAEIAAAVAEDYRNQLAWNDEAGLWYRYEAEFPGVWSIESETAIGAMILSEFEARMGLSYKASWIEQCIKILRWKLIVKTWEQPTDLLPFRNGVLNTQSGEFLGHAPGYRFTWSLPRDHNPLATNWKTIETWMDEATGNSSQIKNILLCWLNACLKGRADLQRFLYLTGAGGTGKGTFIRLAISLVGSNNNHSSSLSEWCGNRFEPVNAYKKRLLTFADEDKYTGGLGNFKKVTGGDAIRGEIKKKQAFDFIFEGMVMVASNYPTFSADTSSGIYRRLLMVPFNIIIPPNKRRNLDVEFEPELAALTNYVLSIPDEIVSETLRQSANQPSEVIERTWDWRMRQDSVAAWLNECIIRDSQACERIGNNKEDIDSLYGSYYRYCEQTGSRPKGSREFSPALLELVNYDPDLNWEIEKPRLARGFVLRGLRLRRAGDEDKPYCLEALAGVGSSASVGSSVGFCVGSEPLPEADCVPYVGLEVLSEKSLDLDQPEKSKLLPEIPDTEICDSKVQNPTQLYTTHSGQAIEPIHPHPTVQGQESYTERISQNMGSDQRCVEAIAPSKWLIVKLHGHLGETTVQVIDRKGTDLTVKVPGIGLKRICLSQVIRISEHQDE